MKESCLKIDNKKSPKKLRAFDFLKREILFYSKSNSSG